MPHGATVTACVAYGDAGAQGDYWVLERKNISGTTWTQMATAYIGTSSSSITTATIDNSLYHYQIRCNNLDQNDDVYGAMITYTI